MRVRRAFFGIVLVALASALMLPARALASGTVSISVFHEHLTPYGHWVVAGSVGNVWVPRVATGWAPYVDGEWVYTDYGWTWVSEDPWGDLPCHYGAWAWVDPYGWVWTPGTVWAPAWVTWAYTDDYIGWAPIPPTFALSATGYVGAPIVVSQTRYVFVPTRQFVGVPVRTVRVSTQHNAAIFSQSVKTTRFEVASGVLRSSGPPTSRIERVTAHKVEPVAIDRAKTRPTTIAESGVAKSAAVPVALPAAERRNLSGKAGSPQPQTQARTGSESGHEKVKAQPERSAAPPAQTHAASKSPPRTTSEPKATANEKKPKPAAETSSQSAHKKAPKPPEQSAPAAQTNAAAPKKGERTASESQAKQAPKPAATEHQHPGQTGPTEQTRIASRSAAPPAHPHPPAQKPKPEEKKPQPPPPGDKPQ